MIGNHTVKVVAIDFDGTLLDTSSHVCSRGAQRIREASESGTRIVFTTTRNHGFTRSICEGLRVQDPIICTNGAQVFETPDGPLLRNLVIPMDAAMGIARLADRHGWELSTTVGATTYMHQRLGQELGTLSRGVEIVSENMDAIMAGPMRILSWQADAIETIGRYCTAELAEVCHTEVYYTPSGAAQSLGVFPVGADKGSALSLVLTHLGISPRHVMAVGDNTNDVAMFERAGIKVAMGNATEELKRQADIVAPTNDNEGVAWALEHFLKL